MTSQEEQPPPDGSHIKHQLVGWGLVAIQGVLIVGIVLTPTSDAWPLSDVGEKIATGLTWAGIGVVVWAVLVFGRGVTPSPMPSSKATLQTRGPYRWIRHPMYTGVIVLMAGSALGRRNWIAAGLWVALIVFFVAKMKWEERRLVETYPGYQAYKDTVPALIPFPRGKSPDTTQPRT
ncbi:MAG: isoprenylcysteine carboxylmethyltransferase family protein [Actinomycetia bacterium]|nr:isoprenylcysteine carboxylmethyltransferase family protein [Actinomycetes bacterium]